MTLAQALKEDVLEYAGLHARLAALEARFPFLSSHRKRGRDDGDNNTDDPTGDDGTAGCSQSLQLVPRQQAMTAATVRSVDESSRAVGIDDGHDLVNRMRAAANTDTVSPAAAAAAEAADDAAADTAAADADADAATTAAAATTT